jgi:hypothetical protein
MFAGQALPCAPGTFRLPASWPPAAWAGLPLAWRRISEHIGIGEIIERNGAEIAFPTRTLKVEMAEA